MTQSILTIDLISFEYQLQFIATPDLVRLAKEVYEFCLERGQKNLNKFGDVLPEVIDMERKQTKTWKELQNRTSKQEFQEFLRILYKHKKRLY